MLLCSCPPAALLQPAFGFQSPALPVALGCLGAPGGSGRRLSAVWLPAAHQKKGKEGKKWGVCWLWHRGPAEPFTPRVQTCGIDVHQRPAVLMGDVFPPSPLQKAGQQLKRSPRFWSWAEHLPLLVKNESLKNWVNVWGMHCPGRLVMSSLSTVGVLKPALDWRKVKAPRCACHVGKLGELTYSACEAAALSCPGVPCFVLLLPCLYRTFLTELRISSLEGRLVYLGKPQLCGCEFW